MSYCSASICLKTVIAMSFGLSVMTRASAGEPPELCQPDGPVLNPDRLAASTKVRHFRFTYAGEAVNLKPGSEVRGWLPVPPSNGHQRVSLHDSTLPGRVSTDRESEYGNCMVFFETKAPESGELSFSMTWDVVRAEVKSRARARRGTEAKPSAAESGRGLADRERQRFLKPNRYVPVSGRPLQLLNGRSVPDSSVELARFIYDLTGDHMKYDKSRPGYGRGDAVWACDSRFGNCTDFHSLFISLARAKGLPARFEIGFPVPEQRGEGSIGGYHCWVFFHTQDHGWLPADISEADKHPEMKDYYFGNLTENRIVFSVGRDLNLVPRQSGEPLNFFVYPYLEVDGKPPGQKHLNLSFSYADVE